ncbi:hypothetical protein [Natrinema versiforme]|uniref:Lipoprotein n=1 Tax=Natrinema versiforme JCM 10478 TaxID=1227496 RepID=L9XN28_9EURY|nr:hypothetical protein [Natrinema versiforme]ELY63145.1 hypothetical protein C489_20056 [Natrinema versiforme JCM 10478]
MVPPTTRRRYLSGLAIAASASLGGCLSNAATNDDDPDADADDAPNDESEPDSETQPSSDDVSGTPETLLRQYVETSAEASDPAEVGAYFHPIHPFHPDTLEAETAEAWLLKDDPVSEIETETTDRDVTPNAVLSAPVLQASSIERDAVADALEGERTAVVDVSVIDESGETTAFNAVTVTADGEWSILAQGIETDDRPKEPSSFDARVVEDIEFDAEADRARVQLVDSPVADSVTAKAETAYSSRSSSTPAVIDYFDLSLDPDGDEVVVTATVDGETRPVHREQYPVADRAVDEISFDERPDTELFDATARVEFTGEQTGDRIVVESTVQGDEASIEPADTATHLTVGVDAEDDEVVVTLTDGEEPEEIHRERYYP